MMAAILFFTGADGCCAVMYAERTLSGGVDATPFWFLRAFTAHGVQGPGIVVWRKIWPGQWLYRIVMYGMHLIALVHADLAAVGGCAEGRFANREPFT